MRLESLLAATGGRLLNDPSVSRFESITLALHKVTRGTLFVAKNPVDIPEALKRGAYGILAEEIPAVTDEETAWILVESLYGALPRLLRLWLVENPRTFHAVEPVAFDYLKQMNHDTRVLLLSGNQETMSETVLASREDDILLCAKRLFMDRLGAEYTPLATDTVESTLLGGTLFETTAVVDGHYLERAPVPRCLFDRFLEAYAILKTLDARFGLHHLGPVAAFDPLFLNRYGEPVDFGSTDRVVILTAAAPSCACASALDSVSWLSRKLFLPTELKFGCDIKTAIERFDSIDTLLARLAQRWAAPGYTVVAGMERAPFLEALARYNPVDRPHGNKGLF